MSLGKYILLLTILPGMSGWAVEPTEDEKRLQKDIGGSDAEHVLAYLRSQMVTETSKEQIAKLIEQMGSDNFKERQEATKRIVMAGPAALPQLRAASNHADKEIAGRARRCITDIESGPRGELITIAIRQLTRMRHEKAVEVLLAYLPSV